VGVSSFTEAEENPRIVLPDYSALEGQQRDKLTALRARRGGAEVTRALGRVASAANGEKNLMLPIVAAVKSLATLGEVSDTLRAAWGTYDEGPSTR
jgi:methylmalonyl-CoA mutase N-terminal domain/subunit